ncbi:GNAT family N-acetyltransferase [Winogradskyella haliclonae]|uniref:Alanine acetyltransferase n=1 Tax=Winogradskyella haliclonae TaxID=2048558 RepID=A0ABQ2BU84_9FLAO|nr:GNAT family N-acetyltransferase [Winogradskyella haliclonae]GGI56036.1 alanine acetyltransferase [Winogradskyella haliclonae]
MKIAETERLILSKITVEDAPFILELMNTPGWLKFIGDRNVRTVADTEDYIKNNQLKCYEKHDFGYYKMCLKSDNLKPIGTAGLLKRDTLEHVDIGFSILPKFHGKGYGFETSSELLNLAKHTFHIKTVCAITLPTNKVSIGLIEKLGFKYKKTVNPFEEDKNLLLFEKQL